MPIKLFSTIFAEVRDGVKLVVPVLPSNVQLKPRKLIVDSILLYLHVGVRNGVKLVVHILPSDIQLSPGKLIVASVELRIY